MGSENDRSTVLRCLQDIVNVYNINIMNATLIVLIAYFTFVGGLLQLGKSLLPKFVRQSLFYGKIAEGASNNGLIKKLQLPKSWFKYVYIYALLYASLVLMYELEVLLLQKAAPETMLLLLDCIGGGSDHRHVEVDATCALLATALMTLQCARRCYETRCLQIFSAKSKGNLLHCLIALMHYAFVFLSLLVNTEGFVRNSVATPVSLLKLSMLQYIVIVVFLYCWWQQHRANMILVNLRRDEKTGQQLSEQHFLPRGGLFELVSSPHMLLETIMYGVIIGLLPNSRTWHLIALWVFTNQFCIAWATHKWYKETFKDYPRERYAFIPFIF